MRSLIITALVFIAGTAMAEEWKPNTPIGWVFSYECNQVDPAVSGFSCNFDGAMTVIWKDDIGTMSREKKARALHDFYKLGFMFFDFGGVRFEETLTDGRVRICERWRDVRTNFSCHAKPK